MKVNYGYVVKVKGGLGNRYFYDDGRVNYPVFLAGLDFFAGAG